jgi:hypothetical protein
VSISGEDPKQGNWGITAPWRDDETHGENKEGIHVSRIIGSLDIG